MHRQQSEPAVSNAWHACPKCGVARYRRPCSTQRATTEPQHTRPNKSSPCISVSFAGCQVVALPKPEHNPTNPRNALTCGATESDGGGNQMAVNPAAAISAASAANCRYHCPDLQLSQLKPCSTTSCPVPAAPSAGGFASSRALSTTGSCWGFGGAAGGSVAVRGGGALAGFVGGGAGILKVGVRLGGAGAFLAVIVATGGGGGGRGEDLVV